MRPPSRSPSCGSDASAHDQSGLRAASQAPRGPATAATAGRNGARAVPSASSGSSVWDGTRRPFAAQAVSHSATSSSLPPAPATVPLSRSERICSAVSEQRGRPSAGAGGGTSPVNRSGSRPACRYAVTTAAAASTLASTRSTSRPGMPTSCLVAARSKAALGADEGGS